MPKKKVKFNITAAFTHRAPGEPGSMLYSPGVRELDYKLAKQFKEEGRGNFADEADDPDADDVDIIETEEDNSEAGGTEIPEDFPKRDLLIENGFDTMEKIRDADEADLLAIEGVGDATLNTIGNAVNEFFEK